MKNPQNLLTKLPEQYHYYTYVKITLITKKEAIQTAYDHVTQPFVLTQHSSNLLDHRFFTYGTPALSYVETVPSSRMEHCQEIDYCTDSPAFAAELGRYSKGLHRPGLSVYVHSRKANILLISF